MRKIKNIKMNSDYDFNQLVLEHHIVPTRIYRTCDMKRLIVAPRTIWSKDYWNAKKCKVKKFKYK